MVERYWREFLAWALLVVAFLIFVGGSLFFAVLVLVADGIMIVVADDFERGIRRGIKELEELANKREGKSGD